MFGTRRLSSEKIWIFLEMTSIFVLCFGSQWIQVHTSVNGGTWKNFLYFLSAGGIPTLRSTLVGLLLVRDGRFAAEMQHFSDSVPLDVESQGGGDAGSLTPRCSATLISCTPV